MRLGERKEKMDQTSFYLPIDLKQEVERMAELSGIGQSEIIRDAIRTYLPVLRREMKRLKIGGEESAE